MVVIAVGIAAGIDEGHDALLHPLRDSLVEIVVVVAEHSAVTQEHESLTGGLQVGKEALVVTGGVGVIEAAAVAGDRIGIAVAAAADARFPEVGEPVDNILTVEVEKALERIDNVGGCTLGDECAPTIFVLLLYCDMHR